jgi:hypothetical protein
MSTVSCRTDKENNDKNGTASKFSRTTYMSHEEKTNVFVTCYITLGHEGHI